MLIYIGTVGTGFEDEVVCVQLTRELAEHYLDLYYTKHETGRLAGYYIEVWETVGNEEVGLSEYQPKLVEQLKREME